MRFWKWHALGNSYLLVERSELGAPLRPELARRLCDLRYGIGSDGLVEVVAVDGVRAEIVIWNPDGSVAEFSGNGSRIAAAWLARQAGLARVTISVSGRDYEAATRAAGVLAMEVGQVEVGEIETVELGEERVELTAVSVGNPHAVVRIEPDRETLLRLGPQLEANGRFPERTNVQLVRVDGPHEVTVLVWERGAGETSASGSSAVAVAAAAVANGWCETPVTVRMPGGELQVELDDENRLTLVGPAEEICVGEYDEHPMATQTSLITGVDFICVPTRNFEAASEFYGTVLGLEVSKRWGDRPAGEFETGSLTIALMQSDAFGLEFQPHTHPIALHVDDVEAARAELEARGVTFHADTMDSGVCHMAHFEDPDGNALMLHHRYAPPA